MHSKTEWQELPQEITVENVCEACERKRKPCKEPCREWYDLLERTKLKPIKENKEQ